MEALAAIPVVILILIFIISLILFVMWMLIPVMVYMILKEVKKMNGSDAVVTKKGAEDPSQFFGA